MNPQNSVQAKAIAVLRAQIPENKARAALQLKTTWDANGLSILPQPPQDLPDPPARPAKPELVAPGQVQRRRLGSAQGRIALLHAVAHIELNAIDLAADLIARFGATDRLAPERRSEFITDWVNVCADEARHFNLIDNRLGELGSHYGALAAHNGLWEAAQATRHDLCARLAIAPMILEARGLDVTPSMIEKLTSVGDRQSAEILAIIYQEEIAHVRAGTQWFMHICEREQVDAQSRFKSLSQKYYSGKLKPPFNIDARSQASLPAKFYQ